MERLKNFESEVQKGSFFGFLKNFGRDFLFLGLIVFGGLWMTGVLRNTTHHLACDAEVVYLKNKIEHFYVDGNYFTGGTQQSQDFALEGRYSMKLTKDYPFGFGVDYEYLVGNEEVTVWCWRFAKGDWGKHGKIIASIDGKLWKATEGAVHKNKNGWEKMELNFQVPANSRNDVLHLYCWNATGKPIYFDDFHLVLREKENL